MELFYNPDLMSERDIKGTFVAREGLVDEILSCVGRQPDGAGVQHIVIVGPRGMGKTTMLLMLKFGITDRGLADQWQAVRFPEESYGINDLADFWFETIGLLASATSDKELADAAEKAKAEYKDADQLQEAGLALLKDWRRKHGKRILLLVDNFDMILSQINDERDNARLRETLMNDGTIMLVGCAVTFFHEARAYEQPLYNFFKVYDLYKLRLEQMNELLRRRAALDGVTNFEETLRANEGKLRALEYFTGGNPRLVLMLYRVVAHSEIPEVRRGLEKLLDEVTPYYKAKIEALPPQQRKILDHLARVTARTHEGITPGEISKGTRLSPNQVSAQLKRLSEDGYVRAANLRGKNSFYTLSEPLYAIWHQMRFSREARQRMQWLVDFLKVWYDSAELDAESARIETRFHEFSRDGRIEDARDVLENWRYIAEAMDCPAWLGIIGNLMRCYFDINDPHSIQELLTRGAGRGLSPETLRPLAEAMIASLSRPGSPNGPSLPQEGTKAWRDLAETMIDMAFKSPDGKQPLSQDQIATTLELTGILVGNGLSDAAISIIDRVLAIDPLACDAWHLRGHALSGLGSHDEALASFVNAIEVDHTGWQPHLYADRANELLKLGRRDEALAMVDQVVTRSPEWQWGWSLRSDLLRSLGRRNEAIESLDRVLAIDPTSLAASRCRGEILKELGRWEEALQMFDLIRTLAPDRVESWLEYGLVLFKVNRQPEALTAFDHAIALDPGMAVAWFYRGNILLSMGNHTDAVLSYDRALQIEPLYTQAWILRGRCLLTEFSNLVRENRFDLATHCWENALKSADHFQEGEYARQALPLLLDAAETGNFKFVRGLIGEIDLRESFFPLARALDYLTSGDRGLLEKLSPEISGIVHHIVAHLESASKTANGPTAKSAGLGRKDRSRRSLAKRKE